MTALTVPARPEEGTRLRPLPWRRMAWVTWRQHRFALTVFFAASSSLLVACDAADRQARSHAGAVDRHAERFQLRQHGLEVRARLALVLGLEALEHERSPRLAAALSESLDPGTGRYSAQASSYLPTVVAVKWTLISIPGTRSCLNRSGGTQKLWMTSSLAITSLTGLPKGTCSSLISRSPSAFAIAVIWAAESPTPRSMRPASRSVVCRVI